MKKSMMMAGVTLAAVTFGWSATAAAQSTTTTYTCQPGQKLGSTSSFKSGQAPATVRNRDAGGTFCLRFQARAFTRNKAGSLKCTKRTQTLFASTQFKNPSSFHALFPKSQSKEDTPGRFFACAAVSSPRTNKVQCSKDRTARIGTWAKFRVPQFASFFDSNGLTCVSVLEPMDGSAKCFGEYKLLETGKYFNQSNVPGVPSYKPPKKKIGDVYKSCVRVTKPKTMTPSSGGKA
jgi:hypothetical protein